MATFPDLAPELKLHIASEIDLDDIEAFTLCSKLCHELSEKRLMEQYARKRNFSTVAVGNISALTWDEDPQIRGIHPLAALRDLLAVPQAWLCTKSLVVGFIEDEDEDCFFHQREEGEMDKVELQDTVAQFKCDKRLLNKVLEVQQYMYPERMKTSLEKCPKAEQWTTAILSGSKQAAASLLVAMLPNLQKLRLVDRWQWVAQSTFLSALNNLLCAAVSKEHNMTGINIFSKLTEVGMRGLSARAGVNYELFKGFMLLPSMRTIKGQVVDGEAVEPFLEASNGVSNVTSLEFYRSAIDAASFSGTLCAIRGLKKFVYDSWPYSPLNQPRLIVGVLKLHARNTLTHLELTGCPFKKDPYVADCAYDEDEPFIGSLCAFGVLETIKLETTMLWKKIENQRAGEPYELVEPERLVDILPVSTRRLTLVGRLSSKNATLMLGSLPALKEKLLPKLSMILFEDVRRSKMDEKMVVECENAGVEMRFWHQ